jgi:2-polyprenyl-6-methoxyphenol hydroxylase-like FAD-dependent oxidoreductase
VVGADGSHSAIRSAIGLDFLGETYPSQFVLADVELTSPPCADDEAITHMSPYGVTVMGWLPSGNYRIVASVDGDADAPKQRAGPSWTGFSEYGASTPSSPPPQKPNTS